MTVQNRHYTYDNNLKLKDAGLIAATANAQVGGAAKILDVGAGRIDSRVIVDATAIETDTGDEKYQILVQGSTTSDFSAGIINLAEKTLGAAAVTGASAASAVGRYEIPFTNDMDGVVYQYVRVRIVVAGTIATGVNFSAWLTRR